MNFKTLLLLPALVFSFNGVPLSKPAPASAQANPSLNSVTATRENCLQAKAAVVTVYAGQEIGSGSIVSPEGVVLTNNHVVRDVRQRQARTVVVKLADGSRYPGQLISTDTQNDLALIKLSANRQFPTVPLAGAAGVQAGQRVCAIGSPYGRPGVMTEGTFTNFRSNGDLKSAVVLRPGNSGGPLLNARGEMIGVNKAIWQSSSGENSGISFATSAAIARNFIQRNNFSVTARSSQSPTYPGTIAQAGRPVDRASGRLGVVLDTRSLVVTQVDSGSPAAASGIRRGDRLLAVNGERLEDFDELRSFLSQRPSSAVLTIARQQQVANLRVWF